MLRSYFIFVAEDSKMLYLLWVECSSDKAHEVIIRESECAASLGPLRWPLVHRARGILQINS